MWSACGGRQLAACHAAVRGPTLVLVPVAQLDKAPDYESGDWGFKSLLGYIFCSVVAAFLNMCADSETCFAVLVGTVHRGPGWMAERSKAPVSGTGLFGGVGSNPTPITIFSSLLVFFV